ncbi:MAG TPA: hypothetical protein VFE58_00490 [Tepidisphaeraceae bacterium]|jgi:DNA-binding XRE family transcriptional regulator|nr:hypothetical protein [Tepidisphaeraceae bacterium]
MATAVKHPGSGKKVVLARSTGVGEVRLLRQRHGISQGLLGRLLDVSLRSISSAEAQRVAPAKIRRGVAQLNRLCQAMGEVMDAKHVGDWLDGPNEMLGGLKPVEAIERGQIDLVWQVVEGLRAGLPL